MDDVEDRLRAVEDRLALIELEAMYARSFDDHDGDTWCALFTPDGVYQSRSPEGTPPTTFVQGTEALRRYCTEAPFVGLHLFHLPQLSIALDHATGRLHLEYYGSFHQDEGSPYMKMAGYYDVAYTRQEGTWRIAHRTTTAFAREARTLLGYVPGSGLPPVARR